LRKVYEMVGFLSTSGF